MKTEPLFKYTLIILGLISMVLILGFAFYHRFEEALYSLLILSVCFITTLVCQLLWAKWEAERALKQGEFDRKQHIKQLETQKEELQHKQYLQNQNIKEFVALLKDYKGEQSADFQKFIEWAKKQ